MAENRCIAAREDGSRLPSEGRLHRVSEQVDASMHSMQATVGDAVLDRSMAQPGQKQLVRGTTPCCEAAIRAIAASPVAAGATTAVTACHKRR